jgi:hypothetical protein
MRHSITLVTLPLWLALSLAQLSPARADPPGNVHITPGMIAFEYWQFDGETHLSCTHSIEDPDAQDWEVNCRNVSGEILKKYRVHLWLTVYALASGPAKQAYEPVLGHRLGNGQPPSQRWCHALVQVQGAVEPQLNHGVPVSRERYGRTLPVARSG